MNVFQLLQYVLQSDISELVSRAVTLHHTTQMLQGKLKAVSYGDIPFAREAGANEELLCSSLLHLLHTSSGRLAHFNTMVF